MTTEKDPSKENDFFLKKMKEINKFRFVESASKLSFKMLPRKVLLQISPSGDSLDHY